MSYLPDESKVVDRPKDGKREQAFDAPVSSTGQALEWMAAMCPHVPNKGEQLVRYYGFYSNVSRGKRKKQDQDEWVPCVLEPDSDKNSKEYPKNWARLIQKIHKVDPLTYSKARPEPVEGCHGPMRVISFFMQKAISYQT